MPKSENFNFPFATWSFDKCRFMIALHSKNGGIIMKTKLFKSVLSLALALAIILGGSIGLGNSRELRPQCDYDHTHVVQ